jgi:hypothetical protein
MARFAATAKRHNAGLQLRCAISNRAEGTKLLEKDAIAPSAASTCSAARYITLKPPELRQNFANVSIHS